MQAYSFTWLEFLLVSIYLQILLALLEFKTKFTGKILAEHYIEQLPRAFLIVLDFEFAQINFIIK